MKRLLVGYLVVLWSFLLVACEEDSDSTVVAPTATPPTQVPSASPSFDVPPQRRVPPEVGAVRATIIDAATRHDYERLRPVLDPAVFLSDFGFGVDPVARWQAKGSEPLETMAALLKMSFTKKKTNEGLLYQWPAYTAESAAADLRDRDRRLFLEVLPQKKVESLFGHEYGYVGPRIGILRDGTWWFFVLEGGP